MNAYKFKKKNSCGLRELGHYPKTFSKAIQYIQETQQEKGCKVFV